MKNSYFRSKKAFDQKFKQLRKPAPQNGLKCTSEELWKGEAGRQGQVQ